ncbi:MAG: DUF2437 domain-containing protein, partial [Chromatiales bacterium]|nr:DUF2437 domain-containing protein [Chromatiales bacterium]
MRWARFEYQGAVSQGIVNGDNLELISGDMFGDWERTGATISLADAELLIPYEPATFYAAGLNYLDHVLEFAAAHGREPNIPEKPDIGYRANNALVGHGADVVVPKDATDRIQYEAELVVVIGQQAKHLSEADALSCVFGYT